MIRRRSGFTIVELLTVVAIIGIIAALAMAGLARARMASNSASAVGSLRAINTGQLAFRFTCGNGEFSPSLQNLGIPVSGYPGYISPDLSGAAPVKKSGYEFGVGTANASGNVSCNGGTTALSYHVTGSPLQWGNTRYFGTNGGGAIFESTQTLVGVMPDVGAPPAPAVPLQK